MGTFAERSNGDKMQSLNETENSFGTSIRSENLEEARLIEWKAF